MSATIICMKWGTRYGPHFVNRLYAGVIRHTRMPVRFVCLTDDATGLKPGIEVKPLPRIAVPAHIATTNPWQKLAVWQDPLFDITGDVLFLDIDLVITGPLDDFFTYHPGEYCVIENWTQPGKRIGNTSVFRFPVGHYRDIYDRYVRDPGAITSQYRVEQHYVSAMIPEQKFWPHDWCISFKHTCVPRFPLNWVQTPALPANTRIVAFTGKPDPDEAAAGIWPATWYKKIYKHVRKTPWINQHWRE